MIKNKRNFIVGIIVLLFVMLISTNFPHNYPFGEELLLALSLPIRIGGGFHLVGILSICLFIIGIAILLSSLQKWRIRIFLTVFISMGLLPVILINIYQNTFASGIYAISFVKEESNCQFEMQDDTTLLGECELVFFNYSNKDVVFDMELAESELFLEWDHSVRTLINQNGPYKVRLIGKEHRIERLQLEMNVSNLENYIKNGSISGFDITIFANNKIRHL